MPLFNSLLSSSLLIESKLVITSCLGTSDCHSLGKTEGIKNAKKLIKMYKENGFTYDLRFPFMYSKDNLAGEMNKYFIVRQNALS